MWGSVVKAGLGLLAHVKGAEDVEVEPPLFGRLVRVPTDGKPEKKKEDKEEKQGEEKNGEGTLMLVTARRTHEEAAGTKKKKSKDKKGASLNYADTVFFFALLALAYPVFAGTISTLSAISTQARLVASGVVVRGQQTAFCAAAGEAYTVLAPGGAPLRVHGASAPAYSRAPRSTHTHTLRAARALPAGGALVYSGAFGDGGAALDIAVATSAAPAAPNDTRACLAVDVGAGSDCLAALAEGARGALLLAGAESEYLCRAQTGGTFCNATLRHNTTQHTLALYARTPVAATVAVRVTATAPRVDTAGMHRVDLARGSRESHRCVVIEVAEPSSSSSSSSNTSSTSSDDGSSEEEEAAGPLLGVADAARDMAAFQVYVHIAKTNYYLTWTLIVLGDAAMAVALVYLLVRSISARLHFDFTDCVDLALECTVLPPEGTETTTATTTTTTTPTD